jgi:hypothetical protein
MRPAFSSTKQAAAFALLLLLLLLSPVLAGKKFLPPREETYSAASLNLGCYPFIQQQIFEEKGDVDIAIVGSSQIWAAIDTPYVQAELSKKLGRKAGVITLGWNWCGFDALYFITRDLVANRKVHMIVIHEEYSPDWPIPHIAVPRLFRFGDNREDLAGLPLAWQAAYYADSLRGMPRNILSLIRTNLPVKWPPPRHDWDRSYQAAATAERLGSISVLLGYETKNNTRPNFEAFTPGHDVPPTEVCIYSAEKNPRFQFTGPSTPPEQLHFAKKLAALARANDIELVWLHIPKVEEMRALAVPERECWPQVLPGGVILVGIPPASFLDGISDQDVCKLFYLHNHLNKNGQEYFTRAITPTLLKLYAP